MVREVKLFKKSKRQKMIYIVLTIFVLLTLIGMFLNIDLTGLSTCILAINTGVGAYVWGETKRPSNED